MKIKRNGTLLESNNPIVIAEWVKAGYEDVTLVEKKEEVAEAPKPKRIRKSKAVKE